MLGLWLSVGLYLCIKNPSTLHISETDHSHSEETQSRQTNKGHQDHEEAKIIKLTPEQIKRFGIETLKTNKSNFQHRLTLPGQVELNENTITPVVPSVYRGWSKRFIRALAKAQK